MVEGVTFNEIARAQVGAATGAHRTAEDFNGEVREIFPSKASDNNSNEVLTRSAGLAVAAEVITEATAKATHGSLTEEPAVGGRF